MRKAIHKLFSVVTVCTEKRNGSKKKNKFTNKTIQALG